MGVGAAYMMAGASRDDVVYCAMPLFHANAQVLAIAMSLAVPCGLALAPRFSKSRFLSDVRVTARRSSTTSAARSRT
jgi:fatty-acyl-CoA synthase